MQDKPSPPRNPEKAQDAVAARDNTVLVCNAGSGSLVLQTWRSDRECIEKQKDIEGDHDALLDAFTEYLSTLPSGCTVLHRIVHMGEVGANPLEVDDEVIATIKHWAPLAPLHNGLALALIEHCADQNLNVRQYVFSDSALYHALPSVAMYYPLPANLSQRWAIKKYGFHGLAHQSQWRLVQQQALYNKVITVHLGGGGSLSAWHNGAVIDTTMGFTPTDGIIMTTRSGSIDPNIILHLLERESFTLEQLNHLFNQEAGLKGLSGISGDYRDLNKSDASSAHFAQAAMGYSLTKALGAFIAVLGGVDAISFGGGLAENQPQLRASCLAPLNELDIVLCPKRNQSTEGVCALHDISSKTHIWLTPSCEGEEMYRQFQTYRKEHQAS